MEVHIGRVRNYCDEPLEIRILNPQVNFFGQADESTVYIGSGDAVGLNLAEMVKWPVDKKR